MKYIVNENCIGCGLCAATCPSVFHITDEGVAEAITETVSSESEPLAEQALDECPVNAIEHAD